MREIDALRMRLSAAESLPHTLAASWDTFELVLAVADAYADEAPDMFAAFMFAAAAAAEGRDTVGFAPSMPDSPGEPTPRAGTSRHNVGEIADELAGLMTAIGHRLETAASRAHNPSDRQACEQGARQAIRIRSLLTPGQP